MNPDTLEWLICGDPSIAWQVKKDFLKVDYTVEKGRVSYEGWGKHLLDQQDSQGMWGNGLYSPKWISTTYTLLHLRQLGLEPDNEAARKGCRLLLDHGFFKDEGINFSKNMRWSETCITGMILSLLSYFQIDDPRLELIASHLMRQQMPDGGWNCESFKGAHHSSFHTTINVLEGLWEFEKYTGDKSLAGVRSEGQEFLLLHRLYQSHRTGKTVDERMLRFTFPFRWRYDVLRALDYLRDCGEPYDMRLDSALKILAGKMDAWGRWKLASPYPGKTFFEMEKPGSPSRWITLIASRVLSYYCPDLIVV